jgi:hypothetical protein
MPEDAEHAAVFPQPIVVAIWAEFVTLVRFHDFPGRAPVIAGGVSSMLER